MTGSDLSEIPGLEGWSYGPFRYDHEHGSITVPMIRQDGESLEFTVPEFVEKPEDLRKIAGLVIAARERWEAVEGLGA